MTEQTRMRANSQHDGRPSEYRWRPLFNATKFGWRPLLECRAVTLPGHETHWNLLGCPKLPNRSQPLVRGSSPYCGNMWRRYCCLTSFFRLSIYALVAKIQPDKVVRWCPYGDFLCHFYGRPVVSSIFMAALCNRGAIIFLPCGFFLSSVYLLSIFLFFPRLISVATDRMSTILLHMAWP